MSAPLTEAELSLAERELGVTFPASYRTYLQQPEPPKPVFLPRRGERGWDWGTSHATPPELLRVPFPHPDSYVAEDDALDAREPDRQTDPEAWQVWDDECGVLEDRKTAGTVLLQEHGCGFATLLAVTGPLAGTVWWDGRATCGLILPLSLDHGGDARPVTFEEWLDHDSWDLLPPGWG
ncbi:hypothetical protein GCM10010329_51370 [Streptomyces spiroverticillatus]|uniref:Knr4/Smi1-like domain-containing protein n=1 Tax=Streptomyces finlayi TaxID=67296 RepID=A0A918X1Q4_9ACTN|nr:SMI1/KNR4 family protein [Streptomyces finlayi]GHA21803.1 hypothetical protein GCM10010329_51370 [Streptomyces spiroverticillatus]GHD04025.1 hypothetical protein GCM10010334_52310 [Streptomyces finlayi]